MDKHPYTKPTLKVVEFKVERGFAMSKDHSQDAEIFHSRDIKASEYTNIQNEGSTNWEIFN